RLERDAAARRRGARRAPHPLPAPARGGDGGCRGGRGAARRLHALVALRQLRVVARLPAALRARLRRLPDGRAHREAQRAALRGPRRGRRRPRRGARARRGRERRRLARSVRMSSASAEVVVVGATAAGVAAAVAAAEHGAQVMLLEAGRHLGGMVSGGLGYTDVGDVRVLGGLAARFRRDVAEHYGVPVGHYAGPEPRVAEGILRRWLEQAGVEVVLDAGVASVEKSGTRVTELRLASGGLVGAGVVVDATYEGDVLALAGVATRVGREDRTLFGERFAGRREIAPGRHSMPWGVSPFRDDPIGGREGPLIAQLAPAPMAGVGAADGNVMSYGYRLCITSASDRIPFTEPSDYDPEYWELGRRYLAVGGADEFAGRWLGLEPNLPGDKCDANSLGPVSLSVLDGTARGWAEGSAEQRAAIAAHHARHALSFLWFLSSDPAVPRGIRDELGRWGFAPDEFADTGHLPHQ